MHACRMLAAIPCPRSGPIANSSPARHACLLMCFPYCPASAYTHRKPTNGHHSGLWTRIRALGWMHRYPISSTPSHGPLWFLHVRHPRKWRLHPRTSHILLFLSRTGGGCLGGIKFGTVFVGLIIVATLVGLLFEIVVGCSALIPL